jgi:hypothetical protein
MGLIASMAHIGRIGMGIYVRSGQRQAELGHDQSLIWCAMSILIFVTALIRTRIPRSWFWNDARGVTQNGRTFICSTISEGTNSGIPEPWRSAYQRLWSRELSQGICLAKERAAVMKAWAADMDSKNLLSLRTFGAIQPLFELLLGGGYSAVVLWNPINTGLGIS